jgi:type VI secretion system secreted protein VgrG
LRPDGTDARIAAPGGGARQLGRRQAAVSGKLDVKQEGRLLQIDTPLGKDTLVLRRLRVTEALSSPFRIEGEVLSARADLKPEDLVDKLVTCSIRRDGGAARCFNGYVRSFGRTGAMGRGFTIYQFEAVPKMWNMTRTSDCRVFQKESVKDVALKLLNEAGVTDVSWACSMPSQPRDYIVQYNETDFDFLHRLLAEVGIGYCFRHSAGKHEMVFCNSSADWPNVPGDALTVHPSDIREDTLTTWQPKGSIQIGKVVSVDTDLLRFKGRDEKTQTTSLPQSGKSTWEIYLSPGGQAAQTDADPARMMLEAAEAAADVYSATGRNPNMFAGGKAKIKTSMDAGGAETFLVTEILHEAYDETQVNTNASDDYRNSFSAIPGSRAWRPRQSRGRPVMPGLQRAMVTGPSGEEIHVDQNGRIKIQFLWDRYGKKDENSSCWVRLMQPIAGGWGGSWFLPRIGDEVLVAFIDGDADRPVVVGSLYNAEAKPLWSLPADKTKTGIRTKSSKGGGADNFNMLSLDDKKGSEHFEVQAEKDLTILIKNDRTETIKRHRTETIDGKHTETVKLDFATKVTEGNQQLVVNKGNIDTKADMGNIATLAKMGNIDTKADMGNIATLAKMGNIFTKASLGKIEIEALQSITLKVGQSKITVDQMGIKLEGMMIDAKAQMMLKTEGGAMATHKAGALMIIKAGLVMIN